jgi:hypothetical protein
MRTAAALIPGAEQRADTTSFNDRHLHFPLENGFDTLARELKRSLHAIKLNAASKPFLWFNRKLYREKQLSPFL